VSIESEKNKWVCEKKTSRCMLIKKKEISIVKIFTDCNLSIAVFSLTFVTVTQNDDK